MALLKPSRVLAVPARPHFRRRRLPDGRVKLPYVWIPKVIPLRASVGFDTSGTHNSGGTSVATLSNNFTIGAALSNGGMVGFLAVGNTVSQITGASMTWNAVNMPAITGTATFDSGFGSLALFGIVAPTGGTHSLAASWTGSGVAAIGFWSFSGVDQTGGSTTFLHGNTANNGASTTSQTLNITTTSGNGTVAGWGAAQSFSGTQTPAQDWQDNNVNGTHNEGQHILSSSGTSAFTAQATAAADLIFGCGCDIKAAAGAAAFVPYQTYFGPMLAA